MNVTRYEGLSRELSVTVPLLDVILIVLMLLLLTGSPPGRTDSPKLTVTDRAAPPSERVLRLDSDGSFYYRGSEVSIDDLPNKLGGSRGASVNLLVQPDTTFSTITAALRQLNQSGLRPEVQILAGATTDTGSN